MYLDLENAFSAYKKCKIIIVLKKLKRKNL